MSTKKNITRRGFVAGSVIALGTLLYKANKNDASNKPITISPEPTPKINKPTITPTAPRPANDKIDYFSYLIKNMDDEKSLLSPNAAINDNVINITASPYTMRVKHSFVDETMVTPDMTFDDLWKDSLFGVTALRATYESFTQLLELDTCNDYYVVIADTTRMNNGEYEVSYADFARDNDAGETLDTCIYDKKTGIAYIPKELVDNYDPGNDYTNPLQIQLMCRFDVSKPPVSHTFVTLTSDIPGIETLPNGRLDRSTYSRQVSFQIVDAETAPKISVNDIVLQFEGTEITAESDSELFNYDPETGIMTINQMAAQLTNLDIHLRRDIESPLEAILPPATIAYGAYVKPKDMEKYPYGYVNDDEMLDFILDKLWGYTGPASIFKDKDDEIVKFTDTDDNRTVSVNFRTLRDYWRHSYTKLLPSAYCLPLWSGSNTTTQHNIDVLQAPADEILDYIRGLYGHTAFNVGPVYSWDDISDAYYSDGPIGRFWTHALPLPGGRLTGNYFLDIRGTDQADTHDFTAAQRKTLKEKLGRSFWKTIKGADDTNNYQIMISSCSHITYGDSESDEADDGTMNYVGNIYIRLLEINRDPDDPYIIIGLSSGRHGDFFQASQGIYKFALKMNINLTVKKIVEPVTDDTKSIEFPFTVNLWEDSSKKKLFKTYTFNLAHNQTHTIKGLPIGGYYEVSENTTNVGVSTKDIKWTNQKGTLKQGKNVTVTATNPVVGFLQIIKDVTD